MAIPKAGGVSESTIGFVLAGEVTTVSHVDPTRTVLTYLREDLGRTGTKEGCAEGDCGACTAALAELVDGRVRVRAVNTCIQFVPTLDGKELITVEDLQDRQGRLHPVQQALVDCHASQCGFCTPGFVMSLFALYKSVPRPTRAQIDEALAGNLCRCTGYRPIIAAAQKMYEYPAVTERWMTRAATSAPDPDISSDERAMIERLRSIQRRETLTLSHAGRQYFAPTTLSDLAAIRAAYPEGRLLAGGTDVGLWVTKQHQDLATLVYVGQVRELRRLETTATHVEVGASVTLTDAFDYLTPVYPDLREVMRRFASPPIRNAGTLGGNIVNGSPIGDSMPALMALGATLILRRGHRTREVALDELYVAYQKTVLEPGEFLERVRIPRPSPRTQFRAYKISKRIDQDISGVCGAYCIELEGGTVREVRIAYGGMAALPKRASRCEQSLSGRGWSEASLAGALTALDHDFAPITDMRASSDYRRVVAKNLLYRFFLETSGHPAARTRVLAYGE